MRVCVIGCGAIGSLFAANLATLEDVEVWAYDLDAEHVRAINERGLRLTGVGDVLSKPHATSDAAQLPRCDYGIVATKSMHTQAAVHACSHAFDDRSAVCSVQNGIGNEETIAQDVRHVIRGTTFPAGRLLEPGIVSWDVKGDTWIGPFEPSGTPMEMVLLLAAALTRSGMNTIALEDARGAQWTKLIFNAATNCLGALTGLTHGRVCEDPGLRHVAHGLVDEGKAVAGALGISLDHDPEEMIDRSVKVAYEHKASMLQDVESRRATEVDYLNGGIARFGRGAGVPTPMNETMLALIKGLERSWARGER